MGREYWAGPGPDLGHDLTDCVRMGDVTVFQDRGNGEQDVLLYELTTNPRRRESTRPTRTRWAAEALYTAGRSPVGTSRDCSCRGADSSPLLRRVESRTRFTCVGPKRTDARRGCLRLPTRRRPARRWSEGRSHGPRPRTARAPRCVPCARCSPAPAAASRGSARRVRAPSEARVDHVVPPTTTRAGGSSPLRAARSSMTSGARYSSRPEMYVARTASRNGASRSSLPQ